MCKMRIKNKKADMTTFLGGLDVEHREKRATSPKLTPFYCCIDKRTSEDDE